MHAGKEIVMQIEWVRKLTSRKWWISVSAFIVACLVLFGVDSGTVEKIGAIILLAADVCGYTIGEGLADAGNREGL